MIISIHALVKRATIGNMGLAGVGSDFNPRPRKEGDFAVHKKTAQPQYFNPRPRKEGDLFKSSYSFKSFYISIHALVKRATMKRQKKRSLLLFQSTPS